MWGSSSIYTEALYHPTLRDEVLYLPVGQMNSVNPPVRTCGGGWPTPLDQENLS